MVKEIVYGYVTWDCLFLTAVKVYSCDFVTVVKTFVAAGESYEKSIMSKKIDNRKNVIVLICQN